MKLHDFFNVLNRTSLVVQIFIGLLAGILVAVLWPSMAAHIEILGQIFITALKSVAPVLVFILVTAAISNYDSNQPTHIKPILVLYMIGTLGAAIVAVVASLLFPTPLVLVQAAEAATAPPSNVAEVLKALVLSVVDNPVKAIANANFIGILAWAIGLGIALRHASDTTRQVVNDLSDGVSWIIKCVIRFAPLGIFGLVASTVASAGVDALLGYVRLLAVLLGSMLVVAFVVNPLIVWWKIRRNPFPLVWQCLRESGVTAFFTCTGQAAQDTFI